MKRTPATSRLAERFQELKSDGPIAFSRGIAMWESGGRIPPRPADDDRESDVLMVWLGFMLARGLDGIKRMEIAEMMGGDREKVKFDP